MSEADKTAENSIIGKPFTKDDPRINREGRPKGSYSIVEMIKRKLQEHPEGKDKTYGEYFVEKIMKKIAVDEDVSMMKDIINRVDGMPKESLDVKYEEVKPIYGGISKHNGNQKDIQPNKENQSG